MQNSEWDLDSTAGEDETVLPETLEERLDRFGVRTALLVICIACFIAAIWIVNTPSFEKCNAVDNVSERHACLDTLRNDLLKPPAKGANAPRG
jgi:hypothetical protein